MKKNGQIVIFVFFMILSLFVQGQENLIFKHNVLYVDTVKYSINPEKHVWISSDSSNLEKTNKYNFYKKITHYTGFLKKQAQEKNFWAYLCLTTTEDNTHIVIQFPRNISPTALYAVTLDSEISKVKKLKGKTDTHGLFSLEIQLDKKNQYYLLEFFCENNSFIEDHIYFIKPQKEYIKDKYFNYLFFGVSIGIIFLTSLFLLISFKIYRQKKHLLFALGYLIITLLVFINHYIPLPFAFNTPYISKTTEIIYVNLVTLFYFGIIKNLSANPNYYFNLRKIINKWILIKSGLIFCVIGLLMFYDILQLVILLSTIIILAELLFSIFVSIKLHQTPLKQVLLVLMFFLVSISGGIVFFNYIYFDFFVLATTINVLILFYLYYIYEKQVLKKRDQQKNRFEELNEAEQDENTQEKITQQTEQYQTIAQRTNKNELKNLNTELNELKAENEKIRKEVYGYRQIYSISIVQLTKIVEENLKHTGILRDKCSGFITDCVKSFIAIFKEHSTLQIRILKDLNKWLKIQEHKFKIELQPVNVEKLFREALFPTLRLLENKELNFDKRINSDIYVKGDINLIYSAFEYLLSFIIKHSKGDNILINLDDANDEFVQINILTTTDCSLDFVKKQTQFKTFESSQNGKILFPDIGMIISFEFITYCEGQISIKQEEENQLRYFIVLKQVEIENDDFFETIITELSVNTIRKKLPEAFTSNGCKELFRHYNYILSENAIADVIPFSEKLTDHAQAYSLPELKEYAEELQILYAQNNKEELIELLKKYRRIHEILISE